MTPMAETKPRKTRPFEAEMEAEEAEEEMALHAAVMWLLMACVLALAAAGCAGRAPPPPEEAIADLPKGWEAMAAAALSERFSEADPKILFLSPPKKASVRFRYWTERRVRGWAGLAALRAKERRGAVLGPDGPWYALYAFGPEGEVSLAPDNLEAAAVDPPLYAIEVVDVSKGAEIRLPRPLGAGRAFWRRLAEFSKAPWEDLPDWQMAQ